MTISSDTTPHNFYSPQGYSTLPPSDSIPSHSDYMPPPSFGLLSSMNSAGSKGSLCSSSPGRDITASVPSARTGPYPSRTPSPPGTSFRRSCTPIKEEEDLASVEPQGGFSPSTPRRDISASMPSAEIGPYRSRTPSSPSTSFIRCLGTLTEEEDEEEEEEEEEEEWISMEPQGSLFSGCDISASVSVSNPQFGPYPSRTPSSPSTSFVRRLCTLIEEGEEE